LCRVLHPVLGLRRSSGDLIGLGGSNDGRQAAHSGKPQARVVDWQFGADLNRLALKSVSVCVHVCENSNFNDVVDEFCGEVCVESSIPWVVVFAARFSAICREAFDRELNVRFRIATLSSEPVFLADMDCR
jgi:hypothetical protein